MEINQYYAHTGNYLFKSDFSILVRTLIFYIGWKNHNELFSDWDGICLLFNGKNNKVYLMKKQITDKLTGEKDYFDKIYYKIYGLNNGFLREKSINENKSKYKYLILTFGFLLLLNLISAISAGDGNLIKRDGYVEAIS